LTGSLAAYVIGYTGKIKEEDYKEQKDIYDIDDIVGKTGIEYLYEELLRGQDGEKQVEMSVDGTITGEYVSKNAIVSGVTEEINALKTRVATLEAALQLATQEHTTQSQRITQVEQKNDSQDESIADLINYIN
jgi:penicillin-binding protein 2